MSSVQEAHRQEIAAGERFAFGKNWSRFLRNLTVSRIKLAEESLKSSLNVDRLDGLTFLDIGSGSGLFSLVARRLGATVYSFDYDTDSVSCTRELKRRYYHDDLDWIIEQGSVLDSNFLKTLGTYDIVYSWGVLHHTGAMYTALKNVKPLVALGGQLFIAIYNDQGEATDKWERIKSSYNRMPGPIAFAYALTIIARNEFSALRAQIRARDVKAWLRTWTEYERLSTRGMSRWHDWIDWIGGYPYERATVSQIADFYAVDGFRLEKLIDRSSGYGCNEFVFRRVADAGIYVESLHEGGDSMSRRFARRLLGPFTRESGFVYAELRTAVKMVVGGSLYLMRDDCLVGRAVVDNGRVLICGADTTDEEIKNARWALILAEERPLAGPFHRARGKMWQVGLPDLHSFSDNSEQPRYSNVYLFEDKIQLPRPHSVHDEIDRYGAGRFSHWGTTVYFSTLQGDDPNTNGKQYSILVAARSLPKERSFAKLYGVRVEGKLFLKKAGWTAPLPEHDFDRDASLLLLRNDEYIGNAVIVGGEVVLASADTPEPELDNADFFLASATVSDVGPPFANQRGSMWAKEMPELRALADDVTGDRSPVFLFEDGRQLAYPHSSHDDIDKLGKGRFSHWGTALLFSAYDNSDPNDNDRRYQILVPNPRDR